MTAWGLIVDFKILMARPEGLEPPTLGFEVSLDHLQTQFYSVVLNVANTLFA
jgi:hypothetical protein